MPEGDTIFLAVAVLRRVLRGERLKRPDPTAPQIAAACTRQEMVRRVIHDVTPHGISPSRRSTARVLSWDRNDGHRMTRRVRFLLFILGLLAFDSLPLAGLLTAPAATNTGVKLLGVGLRGDVDNLVLRNLKLAFRVEKRGAGGWNLAFLTALPNVRRLEIQNAEVLATFEGGPQQLALTHVNVTIEEFSPQAGGHVALDARFTYTGGGDAALVAGGTLNGIFRVAGVSPKPHGTGTVGLVLDSGATSIGGRRVSLAGVALAANVAYDQRRETVTINALRVRGTALGAIEGTAKAVLRGVMPWSADLSAPTMDAERVFAALKPFLPTAYAGWTMQGQGRVRAAVQGTLGDDGPAFDGTVTCAFVQSGFSSPDSTRAAQGVNANLSLKVAYVGAERKLAFGVRAEQSDGEFLWGSYYRNLAGRRSSLAADGDMVIGETGRFALSGVVDLIQTGAYSFEANGSLDAWNVHLRAGNVSHVAVMDALLKEYLKTLSPGLADLFLTGTSSLDTHIRFHNGATVITGVYRMSGTRVDAPGMRLSIREVTAHLPFDLQYPAVEAVGQGSQETGYIRLQTLQRGRLTIDDLQMPVVISQNRLEVPEPIAIPFFGGQVHLYGLQVNDVLVPSRYRFGVKIGDVDLGRMTRRLAGIEYPGRLNADFGMMRYENGRVESEGKAVIAVFGGEITATNLFAENLASPSRKMGGDIAFQDISLEELTSKIAIGKMSGVVRGSLRDFVVEYGEPASFVLEIESVAKRGVAQSISTDAIQSISILGTGADSALNRGITQFFKEYPYSKIGVRCVLKNDEFSVNGTIRDGGKEYLVRRGLLRGVDVVNQNPDNVISFRDMEERVKRIDRKPQMEPDGVRIE
jgi:hypothetical protein